MTKLFHGKMQDEVFCLREMKQKPHGVKIVMQLNGDKTVTIKIHGNDVTIWKQLGRIEKVLIMNPNESF